MNIKIPKFDPIADIEDDKLGFQNAAVRLDTLLSNIETPNTFGIYGIWGSGKTSLMKLTKRIIDEGVATRKIATVWFDPWKYEYEHSVPITYPLLAQIQNTLKDASLSEFFKESGKFLGTLGLSTATTAVKVLSAGAIDTKLKDISEDIDIASDVFYSKYENWVKNLDNFHEEFEKKLNDALKTNHFEKLYIFIDDMDRCLPENAIQLMETMKNYLSVANTLFIIGVDKRVIVNHINNKYGDKREYGEEYLSKIIPLSVNLPSKNPLDIVKGIINTLGENDLLTDPEIEIIGSYLEFFCSSNRRQINIVFHKFLVVLSYVNLEQLLRELQGSQPRDFTSIEQCRVALLRWCLIQELYPKLFQEYEWPRVYSDMLGGRPQQPVTKIGTSWPTGSGSHPLAPNILQGAAYILNQHINDGLFK